MTAPANPPRPRFRIVEQGYDPAQVDGLVAKLELYCRALASEETPPPQPELSDPAPAIEAHLPLVAMMIAEARRRAGEIIDAAKLEADDIRTRAEAAAIGPIPPGNPAVEAIQEHADLDSNFDAFIANDMPEEPSRRWLLKRKGGSDWN